ncbi:MAG: tautomerase family protein [Cloacibacillus sp.]
MPLITIQTYEEHTLEQKKNLVKELTEAVSRTTSIPEERVQVMFQNIKSEDRAINGVIFSERRN